MFSILTWVIFGFIAGMIAKMLHPGDEPAGCLPTVAIGIAGSITGGVINWLLGMGSDPFQPSGFLMSILGGVICCYAYSMWLTKK